MAYIDEKKVKRKLQHIFKWYGVSEVIKSKINKALAECTTADVVEVVRCKDCERFHEADDELAQHCRLYGAMVGKDDFCSYGEKALKERGYK